MIVLLQRGTNQTLIRAGYPVLTHWHIDMSTPISIKRVPCRKNKHVKKQLMFKLTFPPAGTSAPVQSGQHANGPKQLAKSPTQSPPAHLSRLQYRHDHRQRGRHTLVPSVSPPFTPSPTPAPFIPPPQGKKVCWPLFIIFNCRKREGEGRLTTGGVGIIRHHPPGPITQTGLGEYVTCRTLKGETSALSVEN